MKRAHTPAVLIGNLGVAGLSLNAADLADRSALDAASDPRLRGALGAFLTRVT